MALALPVVFVVARADVVLRRGPAKRSEYAVSDKATEYWHRAVYRRPTFEGHALDRDRTEVAGMTTFPARPIPPVFRGLTTAQCQDWLDAHNWAYASIVASIRQPPFRKAGFSWWFGGGQKDMAKREEEVFQSLQKMAKWMSDHTVVYAKRAGGSSISDRIAEVDLFENGSDGVIHLLPNAFNVDYLRFAFQDSEAYARAFTVVHEMHHVAVDTKATAITSDKYYSKLGCEWLALNDPDLAVKHAQSYAYYVMGEWWVREAPAPNWPPETGIWQKPVAGGTWGEAAGSPAAAGTDFVRKVVIVAWREPDAKGGRIWHRILRIEPNSESWTDLMQLRMTLDDGSKASIESIGVPAVGIYLHQFFCGYIDRATRKLMLVTTDETVGFSGIPSDYSNLIWHRAVEVASDPHVDSEAKPAIAAYRDLPGVVRSSGLYCVYRNKENQLKCRAKLDPRGGDPTSWTDLPFDQYRTTYSNPVLVIFDKELKCFYWNEHGHFVSLTYQPAIAPAIVDGGGPVGHEPILGSWREDRHSISVLTESKMITLGEWNHSHPSLMAVRNKYDGVEKNSLYYSRFADSVWSPDVRMGTVTSPYCPSLANCGSSISYLFFTDAEGQIEGRKSG